MLTARGAKIIANKYKLYANGQLYSPKEESIAILEDISKKIEESARLHKFHIIYSFSCEKNIMKEVCDFLWAINYYIREREVDMYESNVVEICWE